MANLVALGMKSFGVHIGNAGATSEKIEDAFHSVQGIVPKEEGDVCVHPGGRRRPGIVASAHRLPRPSSSRRKPAEACSADPLSPGRLLHSME